MSGQRGFSYLGPALTSVQECRAGVSECRARALDCPSAGPLECQAGRYSQILAASTPAHCARHARHASHARPCTPCTPSTSSTACTACTACTPCTTCTVCTACTAVRGRARPCTAVHRRVPPCTAVHRRARPCTTVHGFAYLCLQCFGSSVIERLQEISSRMSKVRTDMRRIRRKANREKAVPQAMSAAACVISLLTHPDVTLGGGFSRVSETASTSQNPRS